MKTFLVRTRYVWMLTAMLLIAANINWGGDHWRNILQHDARGYYDYLPAAFIYHDLQFGFIDSLDRTGLYDPAKYHDYRSTFEGKVVNKYYVGTAVAAAPFFLLTHGLTVLTGGTPDGYSRWYPIGINLGAIVYALIGLWFVEQMLRWSGLSRGWTSFLLFSVFFGTHLFYYTLREPGMSHVYSFAFVAAFLAYGGQYFRKRNHRILPVVAFCLAMIALIRPVNLLIVLALPLAAGSWENLRGGIRELGRHPGLLARAVLIFLAVVGLQAAIYYGQTGYWWVYSYGEEGFDFAHPELVNYLFSYRKGLFVYTPLTFVALWGGYFVWRARPAEGLGLLLPLATAVYVFSSWWSWWYGGSFSQRAMVEFLPLFAYLTAWLLLPERLPALRRSVVAVICVLVLICQVQTYQYRYERIHYSEMDKALYWEEFLRIDRLIK